ncbi:hypothetical protein VNI00_014450 [Paramarasmius palmivorus]|uniref:NACHT domain-containing protein n=1 Tax=Paramarasmius palmivorus TaxID=297713 RepID=A0AAW0BRG8_9AGAR
MVKPQIPPLFRNLSFRSVKRTISTSTTTTVQGDRSADAPKQTGFFLNRKRSVKQARVVDALQLVSEMLDGLSNIIPFPGLTSVTSSLLTLFQLYRVYEDNAAQLDELVQYLEQLQEVLSPLRSVESADMLDDGVAKKLNQLSSNLDRYHTEIKTHTESSASFSAKIKRFFLVQEHARYLGDLTTKLNHEFESAQFSVAVYTYSTIKKTHGAVAKLLEIAALRDCYDHHAAYDSGDRPTCLEGTRTRILSEIAQWARSDVKHQVFWLHGPSGTGKSAIACSLAHILASSDKHFEKHLATFFVSPQTKVRNIVPTLVGQLASRSPPFRGILHQILAGNEELVHKCVDVQLRKLLVDPLTSLFGHKALPVILVIDGLDECLDMKPALQFLEKLVAVLPKYMKVFISTGPEPRFQHILRRALCNSKSLDDYKADVDADIRVYCKHLLKKSTHNDDGAVAKAITRLVTKARGYFLYVSTVFDLLEEKGPNAFFAELEADGSIGPNAIYTHLLEDALRSFSDEHLYDALIITAYLRHPLSICVISDLLRVDPNQLRPFLRSFSPLLRFRDDNDPVILVHNSFREFLVERKPDIGHWTVVLCLMDFMTTHLRRNICSLDGVLANKDIPDLSNRLSEATKYASLHWGYHLKLGSSKSEAESEDTFEKVFVALRVFAERTFLHWLEVLSLLGCVDKAELMLSTASIWIDNNVSSTTRISIQQRKELQNLLADMASSIRTCMHAIKDYALQVYDSLLFPSTPSMRRLAEVYRHVGSSVLSVKIRPQRQFLRSGSGVVAISISSGGDRVITGHRAGKLQLWDANSGELLVQGEAFSDSEGRLVLRDLHFIGTDKFVILVLDVKGHYVDAILVTVHQCRFEYTRFHQEGDADRAVRILVSPGQQYVSLSVRKVIRVWDISDFSRVIFRQVVATGPLLAVSSQVVLAGIDMWDIKSGKVIDARLSIPPKSISCAAFAPDNSTLAVGTRDGNVHLYECTVKRLTIKVTIQCGIPGNQLPSYFTFSRDSSHLAIVCSQLIRVWDLRTRSYKRVNDSRISGKHISLRLGGNSFKLAYHHPDGKEQLVSVAAYRFGTAITSQHVTALAISPDGKRVAYGHRSGEVSICRESDYLLKHPIQSRFAPKESQKICHLAFSPNGKYLASISSNGHLTIRNIEQLGSESEMHWAQKVPGPFPLLACAWSGDSRLLASGYMLGEMESLHVEFLDVVKKEVSRVVEFALGSRMPSTMPTGGRNLCPNYISASIALSRDGLQLCPQQSAECGEIIQADQKSVIIVTEVTARNLFFTKDEQYIQSTAGLLSCSPCSTVALDPSASPTGMGGNVHGYPERITTHVIHRIILE